MLPPAFTTHTHRAEASLGSSLLFNVKQENCEYSFQSLWLHQTGNRSSRVADALVTQVLREQKRKCEYFGA